MLTLIPNPTCPIARLTNHVYKIEKPCCEGRLLQAPTPTYSVLSRFLSKRDHLHGELRLEVVRLPQLRLDLGQEVALSCRAARAQQGSTTRKQRGKKWW